MATELFARALFRSFALPSSYSRGVSVPPRGSSCCPSSSKSPRGSRDASPVPVAEETQHPREQQHLLLPCKGRAQASLFFTCQALAFMLLRVFISQPNLNVHCYGYSWINSHFGGRTGEGSFYRDCLSSQRASIFSLWNQLLGLGLHCPSPTSIGECDLKEQIKVVVIEGLREKMVRSLGLNKRNLFITEICRTCKSKQVVAVKMKGHLAGRVMTNRLFFFFFKPIMTVSGSVTILQTIGKSNGLLNKLTKQHPFLRWQNLVKNLCRRQTGLEEQSAWGTRQIVYFEHLKCILH